jgi:hypothetical protein
MSAIKAFEAPQTAMHRFAHRLLFRCLDINRRLRGYEVIAATTQEDWSEHLQMFRSTFQASGYYLTATTAPKKDVPGSINHAWLARHHGQPVGTIRLVQTATRFPFERVIHARLPSNLDRSQAAEIGRFVIARPYRRKRFMVTYCLLKSAFEFSISHGIRWWIGCAPAPLIVGFRSFARDVQILDELPLTPEHLTERMGRESYFLPGQAIRPFVADLHSVSVIRLATRIFARRIHQGSVLTARKEAA